MKTIPFSRAAAMRLVFACLAAGACHHAAAESLLAARPGNMTRYEIPGYTLVTADNQQLRRDMAKLPRLKRALELSLGIDVRATGIPVQVYVVSTSIWDRYLEPSTGIPSEFVPTRFTNYIIADTVRMNRIRLFHEHTHLYVYNQMPGVYPLWFDEGLAIMMARGQFTERTLRIDPSRHNDEGGWIPTARVLRATKTSPEYLSEKQLYSFHFESFSMVYRALVEKPEFGKRVFSYLEAYNNLAPLDEAERLLADDISDLDFTMRAYVNESGKKKTSLDLGEVPELKLPAGTPVSKLDSLLGIATICLDAQLHLDMVHELLDAAEKEAGGAAKVLPFRLRLAARLKDDAKLEALYGTLVKNADDPQVARATGLGLFDRVQSLGDSAAPERRTDLMTRSFDLLSRSLTANADDPEAVWAYAMQAADLKRDMDLALQRLVPMFERLPNNPDMALAAGRLLHAKGDPNLKPYATAVLRYSHSIEQKRWAAERIQNLKEQARDSKAN